LWDFDMLLLRLLEIGELLALGLWRNEGSHGVKGVSRSVMD